MRHWRSFGVNFQHQKYGLIVALLLLNVKESVLENLKIIVALRSARTALGWSQQELAQKLAVAKSTIARIETLETLPRAGFLMQAMLLFREAGVHVDLLNGDRVVIAIEKEGLLEAKERLENELLRRSDRKTAAAKLDAELKAFVKLLDAMPNDGKK